jgi:DNA invertase Pin-like site-specific DNA recombinase
MTPKVKRPAIAAGYARVSTLEQSREGVSLDAQQDRVRQYATAHGVELAHVYVDAGVSGGVPLAQRPEGAKLLDAIQRHEVNAVIALKLDRLFRSTVDALQTVQNWDRQRVALLLLDFNGSAMDTRSAFGRMMLTMGAAFAEMERSLIGERTSAALQHMKRNGVRLGGVPFGFTTETPGGPLVPMPCELATVREILRLRGAGGTQASYRAIARHLTAASRPTRHGGAWKAETVRRIVHRRDLYDDLDAVQP